MAILHTAILVGYLLWSITCRCIESLPRTVDHNIDTYPNHIKQLWGQYSPYFAVDSEITKQLPDGCQITFAQVLSRHGARDPTETRWHYYDHLVQGLQANVTSFHGRYRFLQTYVFELGTERLTKFGEQQMRSSGHQFYQRYEALAKHYVPFVRASDQQRVVESALKWIEGFSGPDSDIPVLTISEDKDANSTLSHGLCTRFETGPISQIAYQAKREFGNTILPKIQRRLNRDMPGANLSHSQIIALMDLCPFETVATEDGATMSPFCDIFAYDEWQAYNFYQTLGKFYGHGNGNTLGPTQGVGYVNELLARMTDSPVNDATNTNNTLDGDPTTFPLGRKLYADFSHDNEMTEILSALGLYNNTDLLSNSTIDKADSDKADSDKAAGYSAAWTVPFAGRIYFEKMRCSGYHEELVRIVVNDRVVPPQNCGVDEYGRCLLSKFVESQSFARNGGLWDQCFDAKDALVASGTTQIVMIN